MSLDIIQYIDNRTALEPYKDVERLQKEAIPYYGQLKRNKVDPDKVFLRIDPTGGQNVLLEFKTSDVIFVEDVKTVTGTDGGAAQISKLWIKKGSIGIKLEPFSVSDLSNAFSDMYSL